MFILLYLLRWQNGKNAISELDWDKESTSAENLVNYTFFSGRVHHVACFKFSKSSILEAL